MIEKVNKNKFGVIEYLIEDMEDLKNLPKKDTDNTSYAIMRKGNEKLIYLYSSSAKEWVLINEDLSSIKSSLENLESEVNELKEGNINIDLTNYATKTDLSLKVDKENGKSLISDSEIERLSTLKNYDDSNIRSQLNDIENEIDELRDGNIEIDLTNYVTKSELSTKADKTELHSHDNKSVLDQISTNTLGEWSGHINNLETHITASERTNWNNKSDFSGNYNDLTNKPTIPTKISQLNNDSGYLTSIPSEYVTESELNAKGYLTEHQDISGKADKSDLHSHTNKTVLDGITTNKITEWNNKSTFSGSYTDLTNKPTIPTKTSQLTNDSGYLTSIPSEYVTETELNNKGYLTQHQDLSLYAKTTELTLRVHTDGLIYLFNGSQRLGSGVEIGVSGDIVGYVDSENNIVLSGNLADGTYNLKYEMKDGSKIDVGQIDLSNKPAYTNQIPLSINSDSTPFNGGQGWKTGYRISLSGGGESALAGTECTGFIPVTNTSTIRIKGIELPSASTDGNYGVVGYDKNFTKLTGNGIVLGSIVDTTDDNGVITFKAFSDFAHFATTELAYIRLCSSNIDENSILTVNEEITSDSNTSDSYTNLFIPSSAILNKCVNSSFVLTDADGKFVTNSIDVEDKTPFTSSTKIYIKGATFSPDGNTKIITFKTSGTDYTNSYSAVNGGNIVTTDMGDGVICVDFASNPQLVSSFPDGVVRFVMVLQASTTTITASDIENVVITISEPI